MRTPAVAVRALLAGAAFLISQGAGRSDSRVDEFAGNTVVAVEGWTEIFLEHQLTLTVDGPENVETQAPAEAAAQGEQPRQDGQLQGPDEASSPPPTPDPDAKAADVPEAKSAAEAAAAPASRMPDFRVPGTAYKKGQIPELPAELKYQYGYGSESEGIYRAQPDLDERVSDDFLILTPEVNGYVIYRPIAWLEMALEMILEREIPLHEEDVIVLPSGEVQFKEKRRFSLLVDQAYVTIGSSADPLRFTVGRKNFEDWPRHWLFDTSMDVAMVTLKHGDFRTQAFVGREVLVDLDAFQREPTDDIDIYMLGTEYRGIEDIKIEAYAMHLYDNAGEEGERWMFGLRSNGMPNDEFSYWLDLAYLHGRDSQSQRIAAYAVDVGATYRLTTVPLMPNATLGFALGSGDRDADDTTNNDFRQTGLESNEVKFAGLADFLGYGEVLDPELSNLGILTVGFGIRPAANVSVDLVYHYYWLDEFADELNNTALTAEPNPVDTIGSNDLGSGLDLVVGFRSLFGIPRLGLDLRAGVFSPGRAFLNDYSTDERERFRPADNGYAVVVKLWW